jgi:hypothetical protein
MAEIDPEKILAEFEAARTRLRHPESSEGIDARLKMILVSTVIIVVVASVALWALSTILDSMPRPQKNPDPASQTQDVR